MTILSGSSEHVYAHLSGMCRRQLILNLFGEEDTEPTHDTNASDHKQQLKILIDALDVVGCKGEVKLPEWIHGRNIPWTDIR